MLNPAPEVPTRSSAVAGTLEIQDLVKAYQPGKPILRGITLSISGRGVTAIIGPSGTGKSTLLRCINRLVRPDSGVIKLGGTELTALKGKDLRVARRRIGMVHQEYNLVERLSVIENVLTGRLGYVSAWTAFMRRFSDKDIEQAFGLLEAVGLSEFAPRRADQLSGGQRQRVGIARALMQSPDLILADEPTSSLDPKTSVEVMEIMARLAGERQIPVLVNMHNVELAKRFAERIIGMTGGVVVFDGRPQDLTDKHLAAIYGGENWLE
jgi:phosphonate transport system ATP-binding protein